MNYKHLLAVLFVGLLVLVAVPLIGADEKPAAETEAVTTAAGTEAVTPAAENGAAVPAAESKFANDAEKISYAIGARTGQQLKQLKEMGLEISLDQYINGVRDAMYAKDLAMSDEAMKEVMQTFQKEMMAKQKVKQAEEGKVNLAAGKEFLAENAKQEGVKVLPSGLQYQVLKEGTGDSPSLNDKVKAHYEGTLIDGTVFDSSYKRDKPSEFAVQGVIKGWTEALQLMQVGAKWKLFVPPDLAYGERGRPSIPANSTLIFEVELLEVIKGQAGPAAGNTLRITPKESK